MKIFKYSFVGALAAIVDISLFSFFASYLEFNYLVIGFISFSIATWINYIISIRYVFNSSLKHSKSKEIILIYMVSLVGLLLNLIILYIMIDIFYMHLIISKITATSMVFFWNYFIRKLYVFH